MRMGRETRIHHCWRCRNAQPGEALLLRSRPNAPPGTQHFERLHTICRFKRRPRNSNWGRHVLHLNPSDWILERYNLTPNQYGIIHIPLPGFEKIHPQYTPLYHLKNLPTIPLAILPASPPVDRAPPAILEACPNLSHLEKARVLVTVRLNAITVL